MKANSCEDVIPFLYQLLCGKQATVKEGFRTIQCYHQSACIILSSDIMGLILPDESADKKTSLFSSVRRIKTGSKSCCFYLPRTPLHNGIIKPTLFKSFNEKTLQLNCATCLSVHSMRTTPEEHEKAALTNTLFN